MVTRTNPSTTDPVRLLLEVISKEPAYRVLRLLLKSSAKQKDLVKPSGLRQERVSEALREMFLIGLLDRDIDNLYSVREPAASWALLLAAADARGHAADLDEAALTQLRTDHRAWEKRNDEA